MSEELKNCPFCGGEATRYEFTHRQFADYISCNRCECDGPMRPKSSDKEVIKAWNTRAEGWVSEEEKQIVQGNIDGYIEAGFVMSRASLDIVEKMLKGNPPSSEWLSVKDALPEYNERVLVYGVEGFDVDFRTIWQGTPMWAGSDGRFVSHWLPITPPIE